MDELRRQADAREALQRGIRDAERRQVPVRHRDGCDADLRKWGCVCETPIPESEMRLMDGNR